MDCPDPLSMSIAILQKLGILPEMYQVGCTKLYFRKREVCLCVFLISYFLKHFFDNTIFVCKFLLDSE